MARWLTSEEQRTWRAYLDMVCLVSRTIDRQLQRDAGMPATYYSVLARLSETADQEMRMCTLAEAVECSPSRLSHAVGRLEARGWVRRRRSDKDARGWLAVLTTTGQEALRAAAPGHVECVRGVLFDALTPEQQRSLRVVAETVCARLRRRSSE